MADDFLDLFPTLDAAGHCLKNMANKGKLLRVGFSETGGRPGYVYSTRAIKVDWVGHELGLGRFLSLYPEAEILTGFDVDQKLRPDAEMTLKTKILVEYLTGSMRLDHVARKTFAKYRQYRWPVMFVCQDKRYMNGLLKRAERIKDCAHFGTVVEAKKDPYGKIWTDFFGNLCSLEKP